MVLNLKKIIFINAPNKKLMYSRSLTNPRYIHSYIYVCMFYLIGNCMRIIVNCKTGQCKPKEVAMGMISQHIGGKKWVGNFNRFEAWTWADRSVPSHSCYQSGLLWLTKSAFLCTFTYTSSKHLIDKFSLQVKINQMVKMHSMRLFLELVWSWSVTFWPRYCVVMIVVFCER